MAPERQYDLTDPLEVTSEPRRLVIRERSQQVIEYRELWPRSDLRGAVEAERARKAVEGWHLADVPRNCAFCFAYRGQ